MYNVCSGIVLILLCLFNQNLVMWRMFCIGKWTYKSFMSRVIILLCLRIWILFNSCAISYEFLVVYVYGKFIKLFNLLLKLVLCSLGICVHVCLSLCHIFGLLVAFVSDRNLWGLCSGVVYDFLVWRSKFFCFSVFLSIVTMVFYFCLLLLILGYFFVGCSFLV